MEYTVEKLLSLDELDARAIFEGVEYPWEVLSKIKTFILEYAKTLPDDFEEIKENVWVGKGTKIADTATIVGPAIIGYDCELRPSAYIRQNVIIGNGAVIGNSSEVKNSILFNKAQVPHFNYVGDSVLGYKAHMGAGVITSNLKSDGSNVKLRYYDEIIETGIRKFGAILGDNAEIGCNAVMNPGSIVGRESVVYPLTPVRGFVPEKSILKHSGELVDKI